jgi:hypothetical protein
MADTAPDAVREALVSDLHAESLGIETGVRCDFCGFAVDVNSPVQYEALHVTDLDGLKHLFDVPDIWILDGIRCADCEIDGIEPETDGFEEALVVVSVTETNGVYSVDTSDLEIVSFSPGEDGYYPPFVPPQTLLEQSDIGLVRWHRLHELLKLDDRIVSGNAIKQALAHSPEVPPSIAAYEPDS